MPTERPWTAEDVDRVAAATEQHHLDAERTDAMGNSPCVCGQWWDAAGDNPGWDQHMAEVALAALARAGRLRAPDAAPEDVRLPSMGRVTGSAQVRVQRQRPVLDGEGALAEPGPPAGASLTYPTPPTAGNPDATTADGSLS